MRRSGLYVNRKVVHHSLCTVWQEILARKNCKSPKLLLQNSAQLFSFPKDKHVEACKKIKQSKRKPFDSKVQRKLSDDGTNSPPAARRDFATKSSASYAKASARSPPPQKSNWREQHEEFIRTVRTARGEKVEDVKENDDDGAKKVPAGYIQCPTCERSFNRKAADRHMTFCADQKARQRSPPSSTEAMNKFKARSTYKASPNPVRKATTNGTGASIAVPVSRVPGKVPAAKSTTMTFAKKSQPVASKAVTTTTPRRPMDRSPGGMRVNTHRSVSPSSRKTNLPRAPVPAASSRVKAMMNSSSSKTPKTPVVKFKDKFPNGATSVTSQYMQETNALKEMFKRPDTNFSNLPRTVPGVRTGGMSPTRAFGGFEESNSNSTLSSSISLMKRSLEDLYLRDNAKTPTSKNGFMANGISLTEIRRSPTNGNNRGSTSGSSGGDGDHTTSRKSSGEENGRSSDSGSMPRWCHQCGTKYPMTVAKYCYECGARRLGTLASLV